MKRKRDGFVPLGDVANMVELPDGCPPVRRRSAGAASIHPVRLDDAVRRRERG